MHVSLMNDAQLENAQTKLVFPIKSFYDWALDVLETQTKNNPGLIDEFCLVFDEEREESGWFTYKKKGEKYNKITINIAKIRTYRDLVFSVLHEVQHAKQHMVYGAKQMSFLNIGLRQYNEIEKDADEKAFMEEQKMSYKNFLLNAEIGYSIFVERKKTLAYGS